MIGDGLAWLNARMKASASITATYRRGTDSVDLQVTISAARVSPLTVLAAAVADRDTTQPGAMHADHPFMFNAADLILCGELTTPKDGDTIEFAKNDAVNVYRLLPTFDGERAWKYVNGYESGSQARIQINGRLIEVQT